MINNNMYIIIIHTHTHTHNVKHKQASKQTNKQTNNTNNIMQTKKYQTTANTRKNVKK